MSRVDTMSRFEEPGNEPEFYECKKCGEIKPAKEFDNDHETVCTECKDNQ